MDDMSNLIYKLILSLSLNLTSTAVSSYNILSLLQAYTDPPGFSCPWVPVVPALSILFNMFLFAQVCIY